MISLLRSLHIVPKSILVTADPSENSIYLCAHFRKYRYALKFSYLFFFGTVYGMFLQIFCNDQFAFLFLNFPISFTNSPLFFILENTPPPGKISSVIRGKNMKRQREKGENVKEKGRKEKENEKRGSKRVK